MGLFYLKTFKCVFTPVLHFNQPVLCIHLERSEITSSQWTDCCRKECSDPKLNVKTSVKYSLQNISLHERNTLQKLLNMTRGFGHKVFISCCSNGFFLHEICLILLNYNNTYSCWGLLLHFVGVYSDVAKEHVQPRSKDCQPMSSPQRVVCDIPSRDEVLHWGVTSP